MTMLAKPQAIDSNVTMLGKAYLARCRRDLGNVFKLSAITVTGKRPARRPAPYYAHSTLCGSGTVGAHTGDISFH